MDFFYGRFYMMHFMKSHLQWVSYDCNLGSLKKIRAAEYTLLFRNFSCYVLITPPLLIYELFNGHWPLDFFPSSLFVTRPTVSFAGILVYKVPTKGFLRPTFLWLVFQSIIAAYRYILQLGIMHYLCMLTKTMHF